MGGDSLLTTIGTALGGWTWMLVGLVLLGAEVVLPGTYMLWFAIAAILTGVIALVADAAGWTGLAWQAEAGLFAVLSVVSVVAGRAWMRRRRAEPADAGGLNERAIRHVGRRAQLTDPIVDGRGRIDLDDTVWLVSGPDLPAGTTVRITGADGARLKVEPAG
jgi:membrane protein implicated in regulation of membrane protease activity